MLLWVELVLLMCSSVLLLMLMVGCCVGIDVFECWVLLLAFDVGIEVSVVDD